MIMQMFLLLKNYSENAAHEGAALLVKENMLAELFA